MPEEVHRRRNLRTEDPTDDGTPRPADQEIFLSQFGRGEDGVAENEPAQSLPLECGVRHAAGDLAGGVPALGYEGSAGDKSPLLFADQPSFPVREALGDVVRSGAGVRRSLIHQLEQRGDVIDVGSFGWANQEWLISHGDLLACRFASPATGLEDARGPRR
jgi:hypothetical protein